MNAKEKENILGVSRPKENKTFRVAGGDTPKRIKLNSLPTSVLDSINERRKKNPETNRRPTAKGI